MCRTNSPSDVFIRFARYFQLDLDETSFLFNEGKLRIIGSKNKPCHEKNCSDLRFSIRVLRVRSAVGVNGPVISVAKGENVHQRLRDNNLVKKYGFPEGYCVIPNKSAYVENET